MLLWKRKGVGGRSMHTITNTATGDSSGMTGPGAGQSAETPYALSNPTRLLDPSILLVEDDLQLGRITKELLDDDYRVHWAVDGKDARTQLRTESYDAMVLDRRLPDMDGLDLVRSLRREGVTIPVLMLTALGSTEDIVAGLDGGANDYLTKPFRFEELDARIRVMIRGFQARQQYMHIGGWEFREQSESMESPGGDIVPLTSAEVALISVMCKSPEHVFSRHELLAAAFRPDAVESTVDAYVSYIRQKTIKDLIITVRGRGYMLGNPQE